MAVKRGRYAVNESGQLTWCTAPVDKIGMGRCNHIDHQKPGESTTEFINRINIKNNPVEEKRINKNHANYETYDYLEINYPYQTREAFGNFNKYYSHVKWMEWKITLMIKIDLPNLDNETRGEYFEKIHNMEVERVKLHDIVLSSVKALNDLSSKLEIEPFIKGNCDTENRDDVAKAIFDFCYTKQEVPVEYWFKTTA